MTDNFINPNTMTKLQTLLCDENNEIYHILSNIFIAPQIGQVLMYFLEKEASTARLIQLDINIPEPTAYRAIDRLNEMGLIVSVIRLEKETNSKGGPKPLMWAIPGAHNKNIEHAIRRHYLVINPHVYVMTPSKYAYYTNRDGKCVCFHCPTEIQLGEEYFRVTRTRSKIYTRPYCLGCAEELNLI